MKELDNGTITSPQGFSASAVAAAIKQSGRPDVALVVSDRPCAAAGAFTRNQVVAAPVIVSRETLEGNSGDIRAVIANAGNANACTGEQGLAAARQMQSLAAADLHINANQVLVLSTGVIGVQLPMERVAQGIAAAAAAVSPSGGDAAAHAIMTTDTMVKQLALQIEVSGQTVTVAGMAKGSGMIHPNMGTMLGVVTTDAAVAPADLKKLLTVAVDQSFNRITVDGDTSTNDTVFVLANGASGVSVSSAEDLETLGAAINHVCTYLAQLIVRDGEGASKFVHVCVSHAPDPAAAHLVAQTIATSPLVKTAIAGGDPNWGRILAAAGRAGIPMDQSKLSLWVQEMDGKPLQLVDQGMPLNFGEEEAAAIFGCSEFLIHLDLASGEAETTVWTCDLTHGYITINADYRT